MSKTTLQPGCWVEDWQGQYAAPEAVTLMLSSGWQPEEDYLLDLVASAFAQFYDDLDPVWRNTAYDVLMEASVEAARWAQGEVPDGYWVGWNEGNFGCWPIDTE